MISVGVKIVCYGFVGGGEGGGERSERVTHAVYETLKQWKLL